LESARIRGKQPAQSGRFPDRFNPQSIATTAHSTLEFGDFFLKSPEKPADPSLALPHDKPDRRADGRHLRRNALFGRGAGAVGDLAAGDRHMQDERLDVRDIQNGLLRVLFEGSEGAETIESEIAGLPRK